MEECFCDVGVWCSGMNTQTFGVDFFGKHWYCGYELNDITLKKIGSVLVGVCRGS